ncbi:S-layer protein [Clostridium acetobutylicum]|uniref:Glycoportein or S-layer protein n=1 Tax=Clostridium acetobutylicum (strain ATCC 824 / DSM 792 / JCM 1419 / IAM 19013 / LMG 5710 / NBRC 13948 / NRRL B-527 / VKM B-1787 / 2291 / W) TaxID=272562 RepID=Q97TP1_CLOAB|nr:glycoprotein or S-layer protein [Clostridium acetobutylicum]AAK76803.1 Putative glycoportein or S-layer protein [Clostridium acetobutylicum ATCC 824]AEI34799.1 putative glycoprotein or S-layer protein [Clostridium acetobutylicum DSM 1731]PSM04482.1 S-layer protein [Clostridium sp. NJ4]AWV82448.1 S-layer protein [Clostridium acetobutylicum]MBC2395809.1 S-layer protein [Clostridium acetobutylicum]
MEYSTVQFIGKINILLKKLIIAVNYKKLIAIISFSPILLVGCNNANTTFENKTAKAVKPSHNNIVISSFSKNNKGSILSINVKNNTKNYLIKNKDVAVTGDLSNDGSKIAYADALGDNDPWQIYLHNLTNDQTHRVTNDKFGKSHAKISDNNSVFFLTSSNEKQVKVGKIDLNTKSQNIIDSANSDREVDAFDSKNNKLIMSTDSSSLRLQKWNENKGKNVPILHTILETDLNGSNSKQVAEVQASTVENISYDHDCKNIIICGSDINGNSGLGIYELTLSTGNLTTILTNSALQNSKDSIVSELSHPPLAAASEDGNTIYFTGVLKNSKKSNIAGLSCYPTAVFSYNINSKKLQEVFKPETSSLIFDLNIKY